MSTPVPPTTPSVLTDEEALHRAFIAEHATLTAEAKKKLGDDAVALGPKVVEGAFVRAWDTRAQFRTQDQLKKFLVDDVHHASARALSRRVAAHRFAGHEKAAAHKVAETTMEQSWTNIMHALHGEAHSPKALAATAAASRHEAAEHMKNVGKDTNIMKVIGIAAAAIVIVGGAMYVLGQAAEKTKVAKAVNSQDVKDVHTSAGRTGNVGLTDGSNVTLAPETKILIPKEFGPELRGVKLEGAAAFEVAPGLEKPLEVYAKDVVVVAKGTKFFVSNYPEQKGVVVAVEEGTVDVHLGEAVQTITAGGGLVAETGAALRNSTAEERAAAVGWKSGMLSVTDRPLKEALQQVKRWYGYEINVADLSLLERKVTMNVSLDSAMHAVGAISKTGGLKFGYVGQNMAFIDTADKKTKLR